MILPLAAAAAAILLAVAGAALTEVGPWYRGLAKPGWTPADWVFGPVWTVILSLLAISFVLAWRAAPAFHATLLALYGANWILHLLWSPLFFKLRRPDWALVESFFLLASVLALIAVPHSFAPLAGWLNVPYAVWVTIAVSLNWRIVKLNPPFGGQAGENQPLLAPTENSATTQS